MEIICLCLIREIDRSKVVSWSKLLVVLRKIFYFTSNLCLFVCTKHITGDNVEKEKGVCVIDIRDKIESNLHRKLNSFRVLGKEKDRKLILARV